MGFATVKSLAHADARRLLRERERAPFESLADLQKRSRLDTRALAALAEAGALEGFEDSRRAALWTALATKSVHQPSLFELDEARPEFAPLSRFEEIGWDYERTRHSPRGHPLSALRTQLGAKGLPDARTLNALPHGTRARYAGVVICRQRPGTAGGVTFMTLEDESGFVNLIVWQKVFERHELVARTETFLGVTGRVQSEDGVTNLVAERLWRPDLELPSDGIASRDFH